MYKINVLVGLMVSVLLEVEMKHWMNGIASVVLVSGVLFYGWHNYRESLTKGMMPSEGIQKLNEFEKSGVPTFVSQDIYGAKIDLEDFKGRVVILSFWASWCEPCIQEFPSMLKLVDEFKGQVVMLAISADHDKQDILSFLKPFGSLSSSVHIIWDKEKELADKYGTEALPETYILSKDLKVVRKVVGSEDWYSAGAVQLFKELTQK